MGHTAARQCAPWMGVATGHISIHVSRSHCLSVAYALLPAIVRDPAGIGRWISLVHALFASRRIHQFFRAHLRTSQLLLPLEAPSCGKEIPGLYAKARQNRLLRRVRELQAAG